MFRFILYYTVIYLFLETLLRKYSDSFPTNSTELTLPNFNGNHDCHYAQLYCGCYSKHGGCGVKCSPSYSYTLYNQTYCPKIDGHFLAGFT